VTDKFTAADIAGALSRDLFHFRRYLIVSNVSWGLLPWEADLLVMTGSGYVSEVEIKISIADLKRDARKLKWSMFPDAHKMLKSRWFAMPARVWDHKDAPASVPADAGVIVVDGAFVRVVRDANVNDDARALTKDEQFQLARLGSMRHWSRLGRISRKAAQEQAEAKREADRKAWTDAITTGAAQ
jgi:hypothetical protein